MDSKNHCRDDGYQKGFVDGRRTGGKIKKSYIDNFLKYKIHQNLLRGGIRVLLMQ